MAGNGNQKNKKPACKYGNKCYRKNPDHVKNFQHPNEVDEPKKQKLKLEQSESETGKKRKITDFFSKNHDISDSGSDEETKPPNKKERQEEDQLPNISDNEESQEELDISPPPSPQDIKENLKQKFLVSMPEDFFLFWDFCESTHNKDPLNALQRSLGLKLSGAFDVLADRHKKADRRKRLNYLLHSRYFYDPPEFQTVIIKEDSSCFHIGYYRDDPKEEPALVCSNSPGNSTQKEKLLPCGDNLFAAVHIYASKEVKKATGSTKTTIQTLVTDLEKWALKSNLSLEAQTKSMKLRQKKVVCPTFHGAGIVVPVDDNEVGYRPVPETPADLRKMLKKIVESKTESERDKNIEELQELITLVQFANDECDYGEGLELGLDLFSYGHKQFHPQIEILLPLAYQLLNRTEFAEIITSHLKHRRNIEESVDQLNVNQ